MKKILALMLAAVMLTAFAACGNGTENKETSPTETQETESTSQAQTEDAVITGGFTVCTDNAPAKLPDDVKKAFDFATAEYTGMEFTPVAYLGSQVVAGTNYAILCLEKAVVPGAVAALKTVVIYEDLSKKATITEVEDFDLADFTSNDDNDDDDDDAEELSGGWTVNTEFNDVVLSDDVKALCDEVLSGVMGTSYQPVACLGTQVVAGTNYAVLCLANSPAAETNPDSLRVVTIYSGVSGEHEILSTVTLDLAEITD